MLTTVLVLVLLPVLLPLELLEWLLLAQLRPRVAFHDLQPRSASFLDDVLAGLAAVGFMARRRAPKA